MVYVCPKHMSVLVLVKFQKFGTHFGVSILAGSLCWQRFLSFACWQTKNKVILLQMIFPHFKQQVSPLHTKMSNLNPTTKIRSLGTPVVR